MSEKGKECTCTQRKLTRHGCPDSRALGLSAGQFNAIGDWPEEDDVRVYGGLSSISAKPVFQVARVLINPLTRMGFITRVNSRFIRITEAGREMQERIRATDHWERTA